AKLAWWQEELQGWARGAHRHPLATRLRARPAPWTALAAAMATLPASRERPRDTDEAIASLQAFAQRIAACEAVLFAQAHGAQDAAAEPDAVNAVALLGERLLQHPQQAVPMQLLARHGGIASAQGAERAWAAVLLERWPDTGGIAPRRIHTALLRARLRRFGASGTSVPLAWWRVPFVAWGAARGP
ncbi:MAG: phytoene/squalene synthase family protein, partial [Gammaproteobacteria bacterium]|nr:phytoene/squalene synthase family protein [Gammaproteobacteria bacterium]